MKHAHTGISNKIIADFMGVKKVICDNKVKPYKMPEYGFNDSWEWVDEFYPEQMKYDDSWDWLMPVVDKCSLTNYDVFKEEVPVDLFFDNNIKEVYERVLDFIERYNKWKDGE